MTFMSPHGWQALERIYDEDYHFNRSPPATDIAGSAWYLTTKNGFVSVSVAISVDAGVILEAMQLAFTHQIRPPQRRHGRYARTHPFVIIHIPNRDPHCPPSTLSLLLQISIRFLL